MKKIVPIILSGGSGTRLWPLSRKKYPKQYLCLAGGEYTMLQETILRLKGFENIQNPIIICNEEHRFLTLEQCKEINIDGATILLEPVGMGTAPAIMSGVFQSIKNNGNSIIIVLSADHLIEDVKSFYAAINVAIKQAELGNITTFGINPTSANANYGYIEVTKKDCSEAYQVISFIEKPNISKAKEYIKQGNFFWNSGMFLFKSEKVISEMEAFSPHIVLSMSNAVDNSKRDAAGFVRLDEKYFKILSIDSIDRALIEKSKEIMVVPLDSQWNDIGSWPELYSVEEKDLNDNVVIGDIIAKTTANSYIYSNDGLVVTLGVDNLVIVNTPDATLISSMEQAGNMRSIIEDMKVLKRDELNDNRKVFRPWGWYDVIEEGRFFQVKRLHISAGQKLSLQLHYKRSEHWVVVDGEATVVNGERNFILKEGGATYIPIGTKHSLANNTKNSLEIIEVQSGSHLSEDDIVRLEDMYGRLEYK